MDGAQVSEAEFALQSAAAVAAEQSIVVWKGHGRLQCLLGPTPTGASSGADLGCSSEYSIR